MWVKRVADRIAGWMQSIEETFARDAVLLDMRRTIQVTGYTCGAESAYMILRYFGKARSIGAVTRALDTDEAGTSTRSLLALFRKRGLRPAINARATLDDLRRAIDAGAPVLVSMDDERHWSVAYGYSSTKRFFILDPSIRRSQRVALSVDAFQARWDRWAMIIRPR